MIVPVEIFNEIAKYYICSFRELGTILSLSSEINEYIKKYEIIKPLLYYNGNFAVRDFPIVMTDKILCEETMLLDQWDKTITKIIFCSIRLDFGLRYLLPYGLNPMINIFGVDPYVTIQFIHEIYYIIDGEIKIAGLCGKENDIPWCVNLIESPSINELLLNLDSYSSYSGWFAMDSKPTISDKFVDMITTKNSKSRIDNIKSILNI